MNYGTMEAGHAMDELVAELAMKWRPYVCFGTFLEDNGRIRNCNAMAGECSFHPSVNIAHAWEVVERMKERGFFANVRIGQNVVHCEFCDYDGAIESGSGGYAKGLSAPLVICRAALLAMRQP